MPIIAAVYLFCYFSKNHICSRLILSFSTKIFLNIQWGLTGIFNNSQSIVNLPISFTNKAFIALVEDISSNSNAILHSVLEINSLTQITIWQKEPNQQDGIYWFVLGI